MISLDISAIGIKCGACETYVIPNFTIDRIRYSAGNNANADDATQFYTIEMLQRMAKYATKKGFAIIDVDVSQEVLNGLSLQGKYNKQHKHLCQKCVEREVKQYAQLNKFLSRKQKKSKSVKDING